MRDLPPLRAIVAFEATARLGSMTLAAAELGITPSAVSHRIATLEAHFGQPLFRRSPHRLEPSERGAQLAARVGQGLAEIADACRDLNRASAPALDLHVAASLAAKWLRPRLGRFLALHPGIGLRILDTAGQPSYRAGRDLVLLYGSDAPAGAERLLAEQVRPLCSQALRARLPEHSTPADLLALPLLHSRTAVGWAEWCRVHNLPAPAPGSGLRFDRSHIAIDAACEGQGLVLESDLLTEAERRDGRLVEALPGAAIASVGYALLTPAPPLTLPVRVFIQWLRSEVRG